MKHAPAAPVISLELVPLAAPILVPAVNFEAAELSGVHWAGQEARRVQLDGVRLLAPDLTGAKLRDGIWTDVEIRSGQLAGLNLTGTAIRRATIKASRLDGLVLAETEAKDFIITDCKLDLANLRFAKWANVTFLRCSLHEADLAGVVLKNVIFNDCDLTGADFTNAKLTEVDLRSSRLENIRGLTNLSGATISYDQLMALGPELAAALDIKVD